MTESIAGQSEKIMTWCREEFVLPDTAVIDVREAENNSADHKTDIIIKTGSMNPVTYSILKSLSDICRDDIVFLKNSIENYAVKKYPIRSRIYIFFGWWIIFGGALTFFSVCPICGQVGCPVGIGTTGILAGILALAKTSVKNFVCYIKNYLRSLKNGNG